MFTIVTIPEHHQDTGVLSRTVKFLPSSWDTSLICSQRSHGRLTCNTWRAWLTRGHPVWLLPIHPTHVALSSARNTYRRSSKVSCTSALVGRIVTIPQKLWIGITVEVRTFRLSYKHSICFIFVKQWNDSCVSQWPPGTVFPFWLMKSTAIWWVQLHTNSSHTVQVGRWARPSDTPVRYIFHHSDSRVSFGGICPGTGGIRVWSNQ